MIHRHRRFGGFGGLVHSVPMRKRSVPMRTQTEEKAMTTKANPMATKAIYSF